METFGVAQGTNYSPNDCVYYIPSSAHFTSDFNPSQPLSLAQTEWMSTLNSNDGTNAVYPNDYDETLSWNQGGLYRQAMLIDSSNYAAHQAMVGERQEWSYTSLLHGPFIMNSEYVELMNLSRFLRFNGGSYGVKIEERDPLTPPDALECKINTIPTNFGYFKPKKSEPASKWTKEVKRRCSKKCRIIRKSANVFFSDSLSYPQREHQKMRDIELRIVEGKLEDINRTAWSDEENMEGRRLIRIERSQEGDTMEVHFLIVERDRYIHCSDKNPPPKPLEVSCLKYVHKDGANIDYLITSVEVIKIVEYLVGSISNDPKLERQERGRIRSNLTPLLYKNWSVYEGALGTDKREGCENHPLDRPQRNAKYRRTILWLNLEYALSKALLFYCVTENNVPP